MSHVFGRAFLALFVLATANIQMGEDPPHYGQAFSRIITTSSMRLQEAAEKRPLKLKAMNDALVSLAGAAKGMASQGEEEGVLSELRSARQHYSEASFAWLLEAVWLSAHGRSAEADKAFESFLLSSRTYTEFDKAFVGWDDFHLVRRIVYELLQSRGTVFEGREKQIQVRIPFEELFRYVQSPSPEDRAMNILFIFVLFGGLFFFFFGYRTGLDFESPVVKKLTWFYGVFWFAYGIWFLDLAFELPFGGSRFQLVPAVLSAAAISFLAQTLYEIWKSRRQLLEAGYRRCPHCSAVILKLNVECPECRRAVS